MTQSPCGEGACEVNFLLFHAEGRAGLRLTVFIRLISPWDELNEGGGRGREVGVGGADGIPPVGLTTLRLPFPPSLPPALGIIKA